MRGEFIRGDGEVIPNNVTTYGIQKILAAAFLDAAMPMYMGLCSAVFDPNLQVSDLHEPAVGNGYARQALARDGNTWTLSSLNGEPYVESIGVVFIPTGPGFDKVSSRIFIADLSTAGTPMMLSAPLQVPIQLLPTTPAPQRTFKYRLYLR